MAVRPKQCRHCGKAATAKRRISWSGSCGKCAEERYREAANAMVTGEGQFADTWRRGMARSVGVDLPD